MSALIQKDFCVLWRQMRLFLLVILFIMVSNGAFGSVFIVVWAAMMPYTALAYDERCKWDQLAAMMPYSVRDMVLSKYVLGWLCAGAAGGVALIYQLILRFTRLPLEGGSIATVLLGFCASVCTLSITLPLMFRFGVERGRMAMFLLIFLVCAGTGAVSTVAIGDGVGGGLRLPPMALVLAPAAAAVLTAISVPLSLRLYAGRQ